MSIAITDRESQRTPTVGTPEAAISVRDLRKNYGTLQAVRGISLEVAAR